jgi:hypothetical protein
LFTWSATDDRLAALDACQYLFGGPCVQAAAEGALVETVPPALVDEGRWELFGTAAVAAGVGATMSLPVVDELDDGRTRVIGTVNLYGGPADAFAGRRDELVDWCAGWPPASALRASSGSLGARRARWCRPEPQRDQNAVDWAVGMLAARLATDVADAADRLTDAACRAGLRESLAAQFLVDVLDPQ